MTGVTEKSRPLPAAARRELEEIYRKADDAIARTGVECRLKETCCDFENNDHRLYATSVEIAYVLDKDASTYPADSVLCPYWKRGLCTARENRPLGCRTYFCDERRAAALQAIYEERHQEIVKLAERHGIPYRYLPFVEALRTPDGPSAWTSPSDGPQLLDNQ